jgi:hypothetical protein
MIEPKDLPKIELLKVMGDFAKNWLAHDGLWFQAVEEKFGMDAAIELDKKAWEKFSPIEAQRIKRRLGTPDHGGIPALVQALGFRLYAFVNKQEIVEVTDNRCVFRMNSCRVQEARRRQGLEDFPCKQVGIIEYSTFASTIDPRIKTRPLTCPPDPHPDTFWCAWEFKID